jgi:hypothetical protein
VGFTEIGLVVHLGAHPARTSSRPFWEPAFVDELTVTPEEGLWGFVLAGRAAEDRALFTDLLQVLWRTTPGGPASRMRLARHDIWVS